MSDGGFLELQSDGNYEWISSPNIAWAYKPEEPYLSAELDLRRNSIRLVRLCIADQTDIRCDFLCYPLAEAPPYVALSYTWGKDENARNINLNGHSVQVRPNLWTFLAQMRRGRAVDLFWIDALCIDQRNMRERNFQVTMMRDIYQHASEVYIWLGTSEDDSDLAMRTLQEVPNEEIDFTAWLGITRGDNDLSVELFNTSQFPATGRHAEHLPNWEYNSAGQDDASLKEGIRAVLRLCKREYWCRIWTIQEIMLAQNLRILCGASRVDWVFAFRFMNHCNSFSRTYQVGYDADFSQLAQTVSSTQAFAALSMKMALPVGCFEADAGIHLGVLLARFGVMKSSDILDQIYALLPLTPRRKPPDYDEYLQQKPELGDLRPNYERSPLYLYFDVLRYLKDNGLDLLVGTISSNELKMNIRKRLQLDSSGTCEKLDRIERMPNAFSELSRWDIPRSEAVAERKPAPYAIWNKILMNWLVRYDGSTIPDPGHMRFSRPKDTEPG